MRTELSYSPLSQIETELLAVTAVDTQTEKGPDVKPAPELLTGDAAVNEAAAAVLAGGEFKACANETLLLHSPAGSEGKAPADRRPGQGSQGYRAQRPQRMPEPPSGSPSPAASAKLVFALPEADFLPPGPCARASVEGAFVGDFDPDTYRSDRKDQSVQSFTVAAPGADTAPTESGFREGVDHRREPELRAHPGQRAGQQAHSNRVRPPRGGDGPGSRPEVGGKLDRQDQRAEDGRVLERCAGIGRAAGADRAALRARRRAPTAPSSAWSARASRSTPAASPSSPLTTWRR